MHECAAVCRCRDRYFSNIFIYFQFVHLDGSSLTTRPAATSISLNRGTGLMRGRFVKGLSCPAGIWPLYLTRTPTTFSLTPKSPEVAAAGLVDRRWMESGLGVTERHGTSKIGCLDNQTTPIIDKPMLASTLDGWRSGTMITMTAPVCRGLPARLKVGNSYRN